jgi:F0F1-type ATP synthase membrane subunit b/b'
MSTQGGDLADTTTASPELEAVKQKATQEGHLAEREAAEILEAAGDDPEQIDEAITVLVQHQVQIEEDEEEDEDVTPEALEKVLDA